MTELGMGSILGLPPIVHAVAFAGMFYLVALALGRRIAAFFKLQSDALTKLEATLIALTIGAGSLQLVPYLLAFARTLSPHMVRYTCFGIIILLLPDIFRVLLQVKRFFGTISGRTLSKPLIIWCVVLAAVLGISLIHAFAFGDFGDDDGYHLSAPARWLHDQKLSYLPSYTNTNASMGFEMLYLIALSFGAPIGAKLLHYSAGLFALLCIGLCANRIGHYMAGIIAISALLIANPIVNLSYILPLAYVDLPSLWAALASVLAWLAWRDTQSNYQLLALTALCAGIAVSFKLSTAPLVVAWICVIAFELRLRRASWWEIALRLVIFGLIAAAPAALWLLRNLVVTGNPVYPMLSSIIETRDWTVDQAQNFTRFVRLYSWGVASGAQLSESARKGLVLLTAGLVIIAAGILASRTKQANLRILLALAAIFTVPSVFLTGLVFRYWIFGIICLTLVAATLLCQLVTEIGRQRAIALALISIALAVQINIERRDPKRLVKNLSIAVGSQTPEQANANDSLWPLWKLVRERTPPNGKILIAAFYTTFGASSFGCFPLDRPCVTTDSHLQGFIRLDTWPSFLASVATAGIQYVLISEQQAMVNRHGFTFREGTNEYPFSVRLVAEYGEVIVRQDHLVLYRLREIGGLHKAAPSS